MSWLDDFVSGLQGQTFAPSQNLQPSGYAGGKPFYLNPTYSKSPMEAAGLTGLADEFTQPNMLAGGGDLTGYTASLTGQSNRGEYITNPETGQTGFVQARFSPTGEYIGSEFVPAESPSGFSDVRRLGPLVVGAATGLGAYMGAPAAGVPGGGAGALDMGYSAAGAPITESIPSYVAGGAPITASQPVPGLGSDFVRNVAPAATNSMSQYLPYLYGANALLGATGSYLAGREQRQGIDQSNQLAREILARQEAREKPFYEAGLRALERLESPTAFQQSPSYAFRYNEGMKAIDRNLARSGMLQSGRSAREGGRYASDLASQEYNNWFNQQAQLAGYGPTSSARTGAATADYGQTVGGNALTSGSVRGSQYGGVTGALQGGLGGLTNYYVMNELLGQRR